MQSRNAMRWPLTMTVALTAVMMLSLILTMFASASVFAQNINNGRALYITPLVSGQLSCSNGQCHGPSPANNQNKIQSAADDPDRIALAIFQVARMAFLKNNVTRPQLEDLAAYIGNPGAATGAPVAQVSPSALSYPSTIVGNTSSVQQFAISNTGSAALTVSGVSSDSADFLATSNCASIAVGASCNVSVSFSPIAAGARSGTITVNHNATGGSSAVSVTGTATAPVVMTPAIAVTPASLSFGAINVGSFSGAASVTVNSTGTAPLTLTSVASTSGGIFPVVGGTCDVGTPIIVNASCTILLRFAPEAAGAQTATLTISHNASASPATVSLSGTGLPVATVDTKTMVEYLYVPLNYFFITSRDSDKLLLDTVAAFQRTGQSFLVLATQTGDAKSITRFYFDKVAVQASRGTHFYTLLDAEKSALAALNPTNATTAGLPLNEGIDSWAFLPLVTGPGGSCASGQTPVYRLFRGDVRFPDDPNHRFTVNVATYNEYVALGWDGEGVRFCLPSQ